MPDGLKALLASDADSGFKGGAPTPFVNAFDQVTVGSLRYNTSQMGSPLPITYGTQRISVNFLEFWGYQTNTSKGDKGGGGGGGKGKGKSTPSSSVYVALGICQGPVSFFGSTFGSSGANRVWANAGIAYGPSSVGLNSYVGNDGQAPDSVFAASDPNQPVIGYSGTCYCTGDPMQLGESTAVPNVSFEITGFGTGGMGVSFPNDARPDFIVTDMMTNARYGGEFPSANVDASGTIEDFGNYCQAAGLAMSLLMDRCQPIAEWIEYICKLTVAAPFWSGALFKIVPYALVEYSNYGMTWTPNLTAQYSVADRDFIDWGGESDPVIITRSDPAQASNWLGLEYLDISNAYNPNVAYYFDQGAIDQYGLRDQPPDEAHAFTNVTSATASAQLQVQRKQLILNKMKFKLGWVFALLDPMDVIELTDTGAGLVNHSVRITSITENDNNELEFEAEDMPGVAASNPIFKMTTPSSQVPTVNSPPGPVNFPILFGMPIALASNQGLSLGIAVSGSDPDNWGGCYVYLSTDGETYAKMPSGINAAARMGFTVTHFPVGSDPDTADSVAVNLTESQGSLTSATTTQADQDVTPCLIGPTVAGNASTGPFEFISFSTATFLSQYNYNLTNYIRRGQFNSEILDHPAGSVFCRINDSIYQIPYQADQIGETLYLKFVSFNIFASALEDISDVPAYSVVVPEPPLPPNVENFHAAQVGEIVSMSWTPVDYPTVGLAGYDIGYAPQGTTAWNQFNIILSASNITSQANASVPPGSWTFAIRAANLAHAAVVPGGNNSEEGLSPQATFANVTVTSVNGILYSKNEAPDWLGVKDGFLVHYTGVLVPDSSVLASAESNSTLFTTFVPNPVDNPSYMINEVDTGITDNDRVYFIANFVPGYSLSPSSLLTLLDFWPSGNSDPNFFSAWNTGYAFGRYFRGQMIEVTNGSLSLSVLSSKQEPDWLGTRSGFLLHYTGVLVPDSSVLANALTNAELFTNFVYSPVTTRTYTAPTVDLGAVEEVSVSSDVITTGTLTTSIDYWSSGSDPNTYVPWTSSVITARFFNTQISQTGTSEPIEAFDIAYNEVPETGSFPVGSAPIASLSMAIDAPIVTEAAGPVAISATGTTINFASLNVGPFHLPPQIVVTPNPATGGSPTSGGASSITTTQAVIELFNGAVEVAGDATLMFNGV